MNKRKDVITPNIIVVPMLKKVDETIVGIIIKIEKGLKIPPVRYKRELNCFRRRGKFWSIKCTSVKE